MSQRSWKINTRMRSRSCSKRNAPARKIEAPRARTSSSNVVNLMDALRESIKVEKGGGRACYIPKPRAASRRRTARKPRRSNVKRNVEHHRRGTLAHGSRGLVTVEPSALSMRCATRDRSLPNCGQAVAYALGSYGPTPEGSLITSTSTGKRPTTSIASSRARSRPTFRAGAHRVRNGAQPQDRESATASTCRRPCSLAPTR